MSRDASVRLVWGDEEFTFRLALGQWRRIQERCDAGPGEIFRRLAGVALALSKGLTLTQAAAMGLIGDWRIDDMREVILQGLIGGGQTEMQAMALVQRRVDEKADFAGHLALAYGIVKAALGDVEDEPVGEVPGRVSPRKTPSRTASSGSRRSTATAT